MLRFRVACLTRCGTFPPHARLCGVMQSSRFELPLVTLVEEQSCTGILERVMPIAPVLNDQA